MRVQLVKSFININENTFISSFGYSFIVWKFQGGTKIIALFKKGRNEFVFEL